MKRYYLLLTLVLFFIPIALYAQEALFSPLQNSVPLAGRQISVTAGSGNASRLKSTATIIYDSASQSYMTRDSSIYFYSGDREGNLTFLPVNTFYFNKYDSVVYYYYNDSTKRFYVTGKYIQTFDSKNNVATCAVLILNGNNIINSKLVNTNLYTYTYDSSNNLVTRLEQKWDTASGNWINNFLYSLTYNSNGIFTNTKQYWGLGTNTWWNSSIDSFYYFNDKLVLKTTSIYQTPSYEKYIIDSLTYDLAGNLATYKDKYWDYGSLKWVNSYGYLYSNYVGLVPQTVVYLFLGGNNKLMYNSKREYSYNRYNQPTNADVEYWNSNNNDWEKSMNGAPVHFKYYYELYLSNSTPMEQSDGYATVYPIPAKGDITLEITWDEAQAYSVSIIDMQGRKVKQWDSPMNSTAKEVLDISGLVAGNYILNIQGTKGSIKQKITLSE